METGSVRHTPKILIVGCGLGKKPKFPIKKGKIKRHLFRYFKGGLSCAISCLNQGLDVQMLEKAPKILEVGAMYTPLLAFRNPCDKGGLFIS